MAIRLPDMAWVEAKRLDLGWSREDLQRALIARIDKPVSLTSIHIWCRGKGHPQDFDVYRNLVNESSRPLSIDQLLCLLDASEDPAEIRLTHLGGLEGMRIGESTAIRDKHWQDGWFWFRREKTGKMQELPVHPRVQAAKDQILTCSPAWPSVLQDAKERLEQKTGIRFIAHQLRKTYGQMLLDNGAPWQAVQDCLGHSLGMTGRYVAVTSKMRIEAHACLPI